MKKTDMLQFILYSATIFLFKREQPLFGTLILTDRCNLSCAHCKLNHNRNEIYPFEQICQDMATMYKRGVRVICFSGGEIALWENDIHTVKELVEIARRMGFLYVILATNGTIPINYGEADFILVSVDGTRESHNRIRGNTYDNILDNIRSARSDKIIIYMAINKWNQYEIEDVCKLAKSESAIRAVSFNFHTPFPGTEKLLLDKKEKQRCCQQISDYIKAGYPILNLRSCLPAIAQGTFPKPSKQLMVMDYGEEIQCNRCIKQADLCKMCGYFETAEISLMFQGKIPVIWDALKTYEKYL